MTAPASPLRVHLKPVLFTFLLLLGTILGVALATTPVHAAGLAVDGATSNECNAATSCSVTLTTSSPNDVIIVFASNGSPSDNFGTPSDSLSVLTFTSRATATETEAVIAEEWYAIASAPLSSDKITLTASINNGHGVFSLTAWGISGANTATPFDPHSGLPATNSGGTTATPSVTVSTSNSNDMLLGLVGGDQTAQPASWTAGSGFSLIASPGGVSGAAEEEVVSSTQSGLSVTITPSVGLDWAMIGDAVQAASVTTTSTVSSTQTVAQTSTIVATSSSTTSSTVTAPAVSVSLTLSPVVTGTVSTTVTVTGYHTGTFTATYTQFLSTSTSTSVSTFSAFTTGSETGLTTSTSTGTVTSSSTSFSTTTNSGTVQVTQTDIFTEIITAIVQVLHQILVGILTGFRTLVTVFKTPVGRIVHRVTVVK